MWTQCCGFFVMLGSHVFARSACGWNYKSVRHDVGYERAQMRVHTGLKLTMGGDREVRTTDLSTTD